MFSFFDCFNEEFGPSPYALIFSLGSFSCSTVFYSVRFCSKIREFFIYFFKIKAVVFHIQIDVRNALKVILCKENLVLKREKEDSYSISIGGANTRIEI